MLFLPMLGGDAPLRSALTTVNTEQKLALHVYVVGCSVSIICMYVCMCSTYIKVQAGSGVLARIQG